MDFDYYDLLGVPRDAKPDEIDAAWRRAAMRFDPDEEADAGQLALYREAAETLRDPARRARYDAHLRRGTFAAEAPAAGEPAVEQPAEAPAAPATLIHPSVIAVPDTGGRRVPVVVLVALAILAAVVVPAAAWLWYRADESKQVELAQTRAPVAAERAAAAVLAYSHTSLEEDKEDASRFLTADYKQEYVDTFDRLVVENAVDLEAEVTAEVRGSGVAYARPGRAGVLVFVNQTTVSRANEGEPQTALNRVLLTMMEVDGAWLVDDITSY